MIWWDTGRPPGEWTELGGGFGAEHLPACPFCGTPTGTHCYVITDDCDGQPSARNGWTGAVQRFPSAHAVRWTLYRTPDEPVQVSLF